MNNRQTSVVLMSGGMDSALCAAIAARQGFEPAGLHLNYGQRTQDRELRAFNDICDFYSIMKRLVVDVGYLAAIGSSSLTDSSIEVTKARLDTSNIPSSYVPFRNANILSIAVSWAESIGAEAIFIGAMEQDSSGYPDCRREFFDAFERAVELGTKPETKIKMITPLITLTKQDIVEKGIELGVPFHLTWSCYKNSYIACGECDSCALRLRGFARAGIEDPLPYIVKLGFK